MSLRYLKDTFCEKAGYDPTEDEELILKVLNRACKEVYEMDDHPGCLREIVVLVPPDNIIALPYYVGELRAMRERTTKAKVEFKEMSPKYSYNSWPELWRNWRVLKKSPICRSIQNAAEPIIVSMGVVDTVAVSITVVGATINAARVRETLTLEVGDTDTQTTQPFTEIHSISKAAVNNQNITFTGRDEDDENDLVLAVIPNDRLAAIYTIVDVSQLPAGGDATDGVNRYIDILYKEPLFWLSEDADEFPCEGLDDAIVAKALEFEFSGRDGGGELAIAYYRKCQQLIFDRTNHTNGTTQKEIIFAPNQYFDLFPKYSPQRQRNLYR